MEPGSDGNEEVFCIPKSLRITEALPWNCLVSLSEHALGESFSSADM